MRKASAERYSRCLDLRCRARRGAHLSDKILRPLCGIRSATSTYRGTHHGAFVLVPRCCRQNRRCCRRRGHGGRTYPDFDL